MKFLIKFSFLLWVLVFAFVVSTKGMEVALLVVLAGPLILAFSVLSVIWPLLLAAFGIWGTFRIVRAIRTADAEGN